MRYCFFNFKNSFKPFLLSTTDKNGLFYLDKKCISVQNVLTNQEGPSMFVDIMKEFIAEWTSQNSVVVIFLLFHLCHFKILSGHFGVKVNNLKSVQFQILFY